MKKITTILNAILPKAIFLWMKYELGSIKNLRIGKTKRVQYFDKRVFAPLRKINLIPFSRFKSLKKFRNIHKGERCFVLGNGPSLTIADLEKLKNEITFGTNSIYRSFYATTWRPTYYTTQHARKQGIEELASADLTGIKQLFIAEKIERRLSKYKDFLSHDYCIYPLDGSKQFIVKSDDGSKYLPSPYKIKFSSNIFSVIYAPNVVYSVLQIAAYMGFTEIYLLGCDVNWEIGKVNHFYSEPPLPIPDDPLEKTRRAAINENLILAYKSAKKYADKNDFKIYNATRGGLLEVFERVDLDEVLNTT